MNGANLSKIAPVHDGCWRSALELSARLLKSVSMQTVSLACRAMF